MRDQNGNVEQRLVVFTPINAAGHMQSSVAIADKLRADYNYRCVFLIAGPPHTNIIQDHGHELVVLADPEPWLDYECDSSEDELSDEEARDAHKRAQGKQKRAFVGAQRWPHFVARNKRLFQVPSKESATATAKLIDHFTHWMTACNDIIDTEIERLEPDLVVADTVLPNPVVLNSQHRRPWVRLFTPNPLGNVRSKLPNGEHPPAYEGHALFSRTERDQMRAQEPERWQATLDGWRAASERSRGLIEEPLKRIENYYRERGYNPDTDPNLLCINSPYLNIYMFPEALDYDQDDDLFEYPPRWLRCDSLVRNNDGRQERVEREFWTEQLEARRGQFRHLVYFSLGSIASGAPDLMQRYIDFLDDQDEAGEILYIISKGVNGDKVKLNPRNMLGGNYLPQTFLLERSNLAVIHGGNNSLTESLYYGKPVIVLPAFGDQHDNAQRVQDLKLGRRLDLYTCTREQFLGAIKETLADSELANKVRAIGERMRSRDELGKVTSLLRELVEKKRYPSGEVVRESGDLEINLDAANHMCK